MKILICFFVILLASCAVVPVGPKSTEMNKVNLGMSRADVVSTIGQPNRVSAIEGTTYLIYLLVDDVNYGNSAASLGLLPPSKSKSEYFIKLRNDSVISYGKVGDFGTTAEPGK